MSVYDYDIGVIGGGAAGLTVASGAAQLGARTVLVEKEDLLGGDCLHYGCVPSKTLIKSASLFHQLNRLHDFGLPQVTRPPVDFSRIKQRIKDVVAAIQLHDSVERFTSLGVDVKFGHACFCDEHVVETTNGKIAAKKWVIATGSSPALPPLTGLTEIDFLTNREIFYLDYLPESLLVIGAGPIGIEMAQAFNRLGSKVKVLQRSSQILSREDRDLADSLQQILEHEGVSFHLGCTMLSVTAEGGVKKISLRDSAGQELVVSASDILVAVGRTVNVQGLGLEQAGVRYSDKGIAVDARLRTSTKHIYGAGDVIGGYQFTHAAGYEGGVIVSNAVIGLPRKTEYRWMPHCTYSDPELAGIGWNEKQLQERGIDYQVYEEYFADNDRARAEAETSGKIKLFLDKKGKVLGIAMLGFHSGDLLSEWVGILNGKVKLSTVAGSVHPYPTFGEINKRVISSYFSEKIFSDKVRRTLKLVHRYRGS